jgi:aminoglycoside/choline kinase family phosphotransferase
MRKHPGKVAAHTPRRIEWNDLGTVERFVRARRAVETGALKLPETLRSQSGAMRSPLSPLPLQGSDRLFIRAELPGEDGTAVLMCAPGDEENFARFADIAEFLNREGLGAPEIMRVSKTNQTLLMEDLGDDTLLSLSAKAADAERERLYEKIIRWLVAFQTATCGKVVEEKTPSQRSGNRDTLQLRLFDMEYLLWESSYFADNYLSRLKRVPESEMSSLKDEFRALAELAFSHPQVMIHRDFQSSNIIIKDGTVRIVDFQGARIGHIAYDLVSLLKDPYTGLPRKTRNKLLKRHFEIFRDSPLPEALEKQYRSKTSPRDSRPSYTAAELRDETLLAKFAATASLQRNMQALGAFVFLSRKKHRTAYERFINPGAAILAESLHDFNALFPDKQLSNLTALMERFVKNNGE